VAHGGAYPYIISGFVFVLVSFLQQYCREIKIPQKSSDILIKIYQ